AFLANLTVIWAQTLPQFIGQLRENDLNRRIDAFYGIVSLGTPAGANPMMSVQIAIPALARNNPALTTALIETLKTENAYLRQGKELDDDFSSYYGDLLVGVTGLRDPRAIPALVDAMGTGNLVINALAAFGQPAADAVLERLNKGLSRRGACAVLGRMLDSSNSDRITDAAARKRIEDSLMNASRSAGLLVKVSAFEALAKSDSADVRKSAVDGLQNLAERTDGMIQAAAFHSLRFMGQAGNGGSSPVQKLAVNALGAI